MEPLTISRRDRTGRRKKLGRKISNCSLHVTLEERVRWTLNALKIRTRRERLTHVKSRLENNSHNLQRQLLKVESIARERDKHRQPASVAAAADDDGGTSSGENAALTILSRLALSHESSRHAHGTDVIQNRPHIFSGLSPGNFDARKVVLNDIPKLEAVSRLPSYTAWMFVDRNELMIKDQSIARRRRISYESNGQETFFCLDADEESSIRDDGEETNCRGGLSASEEFISRMTVVEHGSGRAVLETIADFLQISVAKIESMFQSQTPGFGRKKTKNHSWPPVSTIHALSEGFQTSIYDSNGSHKISLGNLLEAERDVHDAIPEDARNANGDLAPSNNKDGEEPKMSSTLALALDSFDTLFCRRCLVFNCALHACLEEIVVGVNEIQPPFLMDERDHQPEPCSSRCRLSVSSAVSQSPPGDTAMTLLCMSASTDLAGSPHLSCVTETYQASFLEEGDALHEDHHLDGRLRAPAADIRELKHFNETEHVVLLECESKGTTEDVRCGTKMVVVEKLRSSTRGNCMASKNNGLKVLLRLSSIEEAILPVKRAAVEDAESSSDSILYKFERKILSVAAPESDAFKPSNCTTGGNLTSVDPQEHLQSLNDAAHEAPQLEETHPTDLVKNNWNNLEQDLCEKGIQIFGKNSCLIAQNILKGCKSCQEIYEYIRELDMIAAARMEESTSAARALSKRRSSKMQSNMELLQTGGRVLRPKFRFGRKRVAPKSALGAIRKTIEGVNGGVLNLCRQYTPCSCDSRVGCGKKCPCVLKNMHCEKYCGCFKVCQNRFRGCQCAKSLCDRRNCPCFASGHECDPDVCKFCWIECGHSSYAQECHNMRILQRKKKRLLLAQSDVCTGWGVFTRYPLDKNDYIGEYTGELISHSEADLRGRIYDRETSFLFNLNDKLVVDAFRKGNKLKFANHSARKPNCYAKVVLVGGDHRVGIFARDKIGAGEELLYDYQYEPEIAPLWATAPG